MEFYAAVRRSVYVEGLSERAAARRFGLARETVRKMLRYRLPPGYRRAKPIRCPKLDAFTGVIDQILTDDQQRPKKQRHTAKRIWERLCVEHAFTGGYTIIKDYVRRQKLGGQEMFVPLAHPPGDAQADFGEALVVIDGVECKAHYLVVDLPHSDDAFVQAFPAETTDAFAKIPNPCWRFSRGRRRRPGDADLSAHRRASCRDARPRCPRQSDRDALRRRPPHGREGSALVPVPVTAGLLVLELVDATALRFSLERALAVFRALVLVGSVVGVGPLLLDCRVSADSLARSCGSLLQVEHRACPALRLDPEFYVQPSLLEQLHPVAHAVVAAVFRRPEPDLRCPDEARPNRQAVVQLGVESVAVHAAQAVLSHRADALGALAAPAAGGVRY